MMSSEEVHSKEGWNRLEKAFRANEQVQGVILDRVSGGFMVALDGATAFLPGSQADILPHRDPPKNVPQRFEIMKMDRSRDVIVVSRRTVLEPIRLKRIQELEEGHVTDGVVDNIADAGAFIDLGDGVIGLLHSSDIAWRRVNHPTALLRVGQQVKVKVIKIDREAPRVSVGMKQLQDDPWQGIETKFPVGGHFTGRVIQTAEYGAFIELEPGVEGLLHVTDMPQTESVVDPREILSMSQEVDVRVLEVDLVKRRISLGIA